MVQEITDRVRLLAEAILSKEGMELVEVEYRRESRGWVLRLYIDREGGVTLEDCTLVNREVGRNLDVEDLIRTPYTLEVSSPGLNRPLKQEKDFRRYLNHQVKLKTNEPIEDRRQFKGKLLGISEGQVQLETEGRILVIPLSKVSKANLEIEI